MFIPDFGLGRRLPPSLRYKMGGKEEETKDRGEAGRETGNASGILRLAPINEGF